MTINPYNIASVVAHLNVVNSELQFVGSPGVTHLINELQGNNFTSKTYNIHNSNTSSENIEKLNKLLKTYDWRVSTVVDSDKQIQIFYYRVIKTDGFEGETIPISVKYTHRRGDTHIRLSGVAKLVDVWYDKIKEAFPVECIKIYVATAIDQRGVLLTSGRTVASSTCAHDSFYPFIKGDLHTFFDNYMKSPSPILILIGPPGTGKSTFLRTLILHKKLATLVAYRKEVVESPLLFEEYKSKFELLAIEDADTFVASRTNGNETMSSLLNDSQGIANDKPVKIAISTNLSSINKIDTALIRPGRCYAIVHFRELTTPEAIAVQADMKMQPSIDPTSTRTWTLSETLNPLLELGLDDNRKPNSMGF